MAEYIKNPLSGKLRGVTYEDGKIIDVHIRDTDDVVKVFVPVWHGRWISLAECANEGVYCSICKKKVWKSDYAWCSKKSRNKLRSNYCPNCGAKMDLDVTNDT